MDEDGDISRKPRAEARKAYINSEKLVSRVHLLEASTQKSRPNVEFSVDHLVVAVKDLQAARVDYERVLGFGMTGLGRHPWGTENSVARFEDDFYIELLGCYDRVKAVDVSRFLEKGEGAISLGLRVTSAEDTAAFLKSQGLEVETGDGTIRLEGVEESPGVLWKWVSLKEGTPLSDMVFFIEYTAEREAFRKRHPERYSVASHSNTAVGVGSVWMVVQNVKEMLSRFTSMGFRSGGEREIPGIGKGREIDGGRGKIVLLEAGGMSAAVISSKRRESLAGMSVKVRSLDSARKVLEAGGAEFEMVESGSGEGLLVRPEFSHGVWLELHRDKLESVPTG